MGPNEKILRDGYARFADTGMPFAPGLFDEDVVWTSVGAPNRIDTAGEWRGLGGVREYYATLVANWVLRDFRVEDVVGQDDRRFAVHIRAKAISQKTGKSVNLEKVDLVTMNDGKIATIMEVYDTGPLDRAARK